LAPWGRGGAWATQDTIWKITKSTKWGRFSSICVLAGRFSWSAQIRGRMWQREATEPSGCWSHLLHLLEWVGLTRISSRDRGVSPVTLGELGICCHLLPVWPWTTYWHSSAFIFCWGTSLETCSSFCPPEDVMRCPHHYTVLSKWH
jgi:hypothetical protein